MSHYARNPNDEKTLTPRFIEVKCRRLGCNNMIVRYGSFYGSKQTKQQEFCSKSCVGKHFAGRKHYKEMKWAKYHNKTTFYDFNKHQERVEYGKIDTVK